MDLDIEKYKKVRMAQAKGARTLEDVEEMTDIIIENDEEREATKELVKNACKCQKISIAEVVEAVNNGADTLEKVMEVTKAGTVCGRCKGILTNIIENRK